MDLAQDGGSISLGAGTSNPGNGSGSGSGSGNSGGTGGGSHPTPPGPTIPQDLLSIPGILLDFACSDLNPTKPAHCSDPAATPPPAVPITADMVEGWARSATTSLRLPASTPVIGPDPGANEWDMLAVGLPVWLWTSEPRSLDSSVTSSGISLTLVATRGATTFDLGDGTVVTCATSTARPGGADPMESSPTCGHTYSKAGTYTVSATTHWAVDWAALGFSGTFDVPRTSTATLEVGELVSVVVR
ncbi:MAG TPA: hypothetical protein VLR88_07485 [Propionibacteriaceae bacterium]|nr:hypothetical protein [Propionibacteriaceae bacterium]